jgi:hypothetical protein
MTNKAKKLLLRIGKTQDASMRLTKGNAKAASELKEQGLAIFISVSTGGADIALTKEGINAFDKLEQIE